ncbi:related to 4-hydroxybenzoate transporter [Rhynchosporium agropyri]|uniref:Related to 4-hydroxybenzoate transporter n=1 Tax=Rhynchosporium agropyri TaxID=914238 RepID=A0A1E1LF53_9HELO|nr:related to 4-hydroxybenzoate transporter [Rhynchosporium agropyri]
MSASSKSPLDPENGQSSSKTVQESVGAGSHGDNLRLSLSTGVSNKLILEERKAELINYHFNEMGMGRYQWYIWSLCGLGYFLDLLWAQAFGLIASPLKQELGFSDGELGNIFTAFSSGLCAGAFVWGILVDIIGRRWAFNGTVLISGIFGLCLGAPSTYNGILVLTAFNGFGIGGNIPIDTTICLEFIPKKERFLLALLSIFQPLGVVVCSGIAYGFIPKYSCNIDLPSCKNSAPGEACCSKADNYGWRYLVFTLGAIAMLIFFLRFVLFTFEESPKYLISRGRDEEAMRVLHHVSKINKYECSLTMDDFRALDARYGNELTNGIADADTTMGSPEQKNKKPKKPKFYQQLLNEFSRIGVLFTTASMARLTILVWIIYAFDYWAFSIAGSFLPTILLKKNSAINVSVSETYRDYIIIYLPGIVGVGLGAGMIRFGRLGRKWTMVFAALMMGISLFLFATVNTQASNIGFNLMEYFFQSMFNAVLYGWTPEAFPASVRGTASGVASFWGRLLSIVSPLIAAHLLETSLNGPLYLAGSGALVCVVAIMFLPNNSLDGQLP